ncbi:MAG: hypothetical protein OXD29_11265 [Roseovarius sp.]|nr:hypothetical protein [Roseovarius sp.]
MTIRETRLSMTPSQEDAASFRLGDLVHLDGLLCTAREGVYMRAIEEKVNLPVELPATITANHLHEEPGIAQAKRVMRCNRMGPFILAPDLDGNRLFERENAKIAKNMAKIHEGTRPAVPERHGETGNQSDEVI